MSHKRKLSHAIGGGALFGLGIVCTIGPGPGLIMMAVGGGMVLRNSEKASNAFKGARKQSKFFDNRVSWMESKIPWLQKLTHGLLNRIPVAKKWEKLKTYAHDSLETFKQTLEDTKPKYRKLADQARQVAHKVADRIKHPTHLLPDDGTDQKSLSEETNNAAKAPSRLRKIWNAVVMATGSAVKEIKQAQAYRSDAEEETMRSPDQPAKPISGETKANISEAGIAFQRTVSHEDQDHPVNRADDYQGIDPVISPKAGGTGSNPHPRL